MTTFKTELARNHAEVIAAASPELRDALRGIAIAALLAMHDVFGDVEFYLDAEAFYAERGK